MKKSILFFSSSSLVRRFIATTFTQEGYDIVTTKTLEELESFLQNKYFSLVVIDLESLEKKELLEQILQHHKLKVLFLGDVTQEMQSLKKFSLGVIAKPAQSVDIVQIKSLLLQKVKESLNFFPRTLMQESVSKTEEMGFVLIGASTGGPRLIEQICKALPKNYPHAVCVVQHMPTEFTANFAKRLNTLCEVEVVEASNNLELQKGRVIIAKGGKHLHLKKKLDKYYVVLASNSKKRFFVPSVDEMFFSAVEVLPLQRVLAIELTGIGDDGADGMVALRKEGAYTIAESQESATVYGMPKEAALRGGASKVLAFNKIVDEIVKYGKNKNINR